MLFPGIRIRVDQDEESVEKWEREEGKPLQCDGARRVKNKCVEKI